MHRRPCRSPVACREALRRGAALVHAEGHADELLPEGETAAMSTQSRGHSTGRRNIMDSNATAGGTAHGAARRPWRGRLPGAPAPRRAGPCRRRRAGRREPRRGGEAASVPRGTASAKYARRLRAGPQAPSWNTRRNRACTHHSRGAGTRVAHVGGIVAAGDVGAPCRPRAGAIRGCGAQTRPSSQAVIVGDRFDTHLVVRPAAALRHVEPVVGLGEPVHGGERQAVQDAGQQGRVGEGVAGALYEQHGDGDAREMRGALDAGTAGGVQREAEQHQPVHVRTVRGDLRGDAAAHRAAADHHPRRRERRLGAHRRQHRVPGALEDGAPRRGVRLPASR